jgi:hypothetical protein
MTSAAGPINGYEKRPPPGGPAKRRPDASPRGTAPGSQCCIGGYPATIDEESSGIIDVADLMGRETFLLDAQIHSSVGLSDPTRQVEHGELLKMKVNWATVF